MLSFVLLLLAAFMAVLSASTATASEAAPESPDDVHRLAYADLTQRVPVAKRRVIRYLSFQNYPLVAPVDPNAPKGARGAEPKDQWLRWQLVQVMKYGLNSVSLRSQIVQPNMIGDELLLMEVDLEAFGWDRPSRIARRAELEKRGVVFKFKDKAEEERFLNPWEDLVASDPYFHATYKAPNGRVIRGWIDPVREYNARQLSYSGNFVLRADRVLSQLMSEKARGGSYSNFLMLPDNEKDFYKAFLIPIDAVERAEQLRFGGAVARSIVAFHNRGLELFASPYGHDVRFVWRTYDFLNDNVPEKNVFESLGGTLKHDGRESIFTLPNGLHGYQLYDGKGKQVEVVPQNIALDMRRDTLNKDRNVINPRSCISCHHPGSGINEYVDVVRLNTLKDGIDVVPFSKDKARAIGRSYELADYYKIAEKGGLAREIVQHQESFARRLLATNGLAPEDNGYRVVGWYDHYIRDAVGLDQAASDMGLTVEAARAALRASSTVVKDKGEYKVKPNSSLNVLSEGQEISRTQWEANYGDAMRSLKIVYPWESTVGPVQPKVKVGH